ncbi:MAG TPA: thiamine diphosphokinase [Candidatus Limnocylindria bacterium]
MRAVLVASGEADPADARWLADANRVVAVDGGTAWLAQVGRRPDLVVGDLDSADPALIAALEADGVPIERHPSAKDASDTELALAGVLATGADDVVILGALAGPRFDHQLANLMLLADSQLSGVANVRIVRGRTSVRALHAGATLALEGALGDMVTLLPVGGDAVGVRTAGLRYPLNAESLSFGRSRGLSNVVAEPPASVSLEGGSLLVVETKQEGAEP